MAGYPYDSGYLLREMLRLVGRPQPSDAVSRGSYFERLSEAYAQVWADIALACPRAIETSGTMTKVGDGHYFSFGLDINNFGTAPIGRTRIFRSLNDYPDSPMQPGIDYIQAGAGLIAFPGNATADGPFYWYGITAPAPISDAGSDPLIQPENACQLIAIRAAINFLTEGGRNLELAAVYAAQYGRPLTQNNGLFAQWATIWRNQFIGGSGTNWITGRRLALAGQY